MGAIIYTLCNSLLLNNTFHFEQYCITTLTKVDAAMHWSQPSEALPLIGTTDEVDDKVMNN